MNPFRPFTDAYWAWEYRDESDEKLLARYEVVTRDFKETFEDHSEANTVSAALRFRGYFYHGQDEKWWCTEQSIMPLLGEYVALVRFAKHLMDHDPDFAWCDKPEHCPTGAEIAKLPDHLKGALK